MRHASARVGNALGVRPNWNAAISQDIEFKTEIRVTRSGVEQREAVRQTPRVTLGYPFAVTQAAAQRLLRDIRLDPYRVWIAPVHWRSTGLSVQGVQGNNVIQIDGPPFWAVPGIQIVLRTLPPEDATEATFVTDVTGDVLTLADNLSRDFDPGTKVYYGYPVRFPEDMQLVSVLPDVYTGMAGLQIDPGMVPQPSPPRDTATYENLEVFLQRPNWRHENKISIAKDADVTDFGRGRIAVSSAVNFVSERRQPRFYRFDRMGGEKMIAFFMRAKGRRGSFWAPSWNRDLPLDADIPLNTSAGYVAGTEFLEAYAGNRVYNRMIHFRDDGTYQINKVLGMVEDAGRTRVNFQSGWTRRISKESRVCWLFRSRFNSDTLSVSWETPNVAHAQFSLTSLPTDEVTL